MKNDKRDALSIANIGKFQNIKLSQGVSLDIFLLRSLVREYSKLTDTCSTFKKKLSADLRVIFPGYNTIFSNITSLSSLEILSNYPSPKAVLDAPKDDIVEYYVVVRKGLLWAEKVYSKLLNIATEANMIGVPLSGLSIKIISNTELINTIEYQINNL